MTRKAYLLGFAVWAFAGWFWPGVGVSAEHIPANGVNWSNMSSFQKQVEFDLPIGTSKEQVEAYLRREKIPYFFADAGYGEKTGGNAFYGTLKHIGRRAGFDASLAIRIHIGASNKVDKVWFRTDYDAP